MTFLKCCATLALALSLSGCVTNSMGTKEGFGTVIGGAGGALAGAQFGKGNGRLAATAAGTLLGALIGNQVGQSLDRADMMYQQSAMTSMISAPIGQPVGWQNPQSGNYGQIVPVSQGYSPYGGLCRQYETSIVIQGRPQRATGTACQQPDGTWKIQ